MKPAEDTLKLELSSGTEGAAVLAHQQPGHMNVAAWPLPAADYSRVQSDAKVLVHATLLPACLLPSGSATCTGPNCKCSTRNTWPAANLHDSIAFTS